ncbi:hypothetical protein [Streptomyces sp. SD15]
MTVLGTVLAPAAGGVLYAFWPEFPESDARACPDSTVPLERQAEAAELALPEHYGLRLIVNIDPNSRPKPAVLVTVEEA